ncbi:DUF397 domain-containing protein [Streptomyces sp. NPDC002855]|uniref:DUF397 domain-containing protein n=1 Tax=Streptomyces sp. NPDC002855 TaxID=3154437 RepID=UPI00331F1728
MISSSAAGDVIDNLAWFKSTYSGSNETECVEVAVRNTHVYIRDSKRPADRHFVVDAHAWAGFVASLRGVPRS